MQEQTLFQAQVATAIDNEIENGGVGAMIDPG